jgi:N-acyl homoserine lactone hydrolase
MIRNTRTAILSILVASSLSIGGKRTATAADSKLPDPAAAGFAEKLYRLDCGHSLANDESVWTPGENVGRSIEFSSTCWLIKRGSEWVLWDAGVPEATLNDPKGWSTLPKLIVYHLEQHDNRSTRGDRA